MFDLTKEIGHQLTFIDIKANETQIILFNQYLNLLHKWNKAFNLTAVKDIYKMLDRHLIDSLSIAKYIEGECFIDIGTGAGLPGIPLAILYPEKSFHLLDSNGKKTRFLNQLKLELGLDNITVINDRVEKTRINQRFDGVLSRAFATLSDMLKDSSHLCKQEGYFYAMKGIWPETELQGISKSYKVHVLDWPSNQTERHLAVIKNCSNY